MAPPVESFPASELEHRIQIKTNGRRRKGPAIQLKDCELFEMVQYSCGLDKDPRVSAKDAIIICKPIVKLFRR